MPPLTHIAALLFSVSLIFTYLWVRLNWVSIPHALVVGFIFNSLFFFLFAAARFSGLRDGLSIGAMQGAIFTIVAVSMGAFFRPPEPEEKPQLNLNLDRDYSWEPITSDSGVAGTR